MCKKRLSVLLGVFLVFVSLLALNNHIRNDNDKKDELIRFHVLANSDTLNDQALKLKVRDVVMDKLRPELKQIDNVEKGKEKIEGKLHKIEDVASKELKKNDVDYEVKASLQNQNFPARKYNDTVLAAGQYKALRIEIGEAKGENWWCVMFPPLCYTDIKNSISNNQAKEELEMFLKEEEKKVYKELNKEDEISLELESKIVEIIKNSRDRIIEFAGW